MHPSSILLQATSGGDPFALPTLLAVIAAGVGALVAAWAAVYGLYVRKPRVKWKINFGRKTMSEGAFTVRITNAGAAIATDVSGSYRLMNGTQKSTEVSIFPPGRTMEPHAFVESHLTPHNSDDLWAAVDWSWRSPDGETHEKVFKRRPSKKNDQLLAMLDYKRTLKQFTREKRRKNQAPRRSLRETLSRRG